MFDRRILLASTAGFGALAVLRWLGMSNANAATAKAEHKFEGTKTDEEWKKQRNREA